MNTKRFCACLLSVVASIAAVFVSASNLSAALPWEKGVWDAAPMDWPYCRGPEMNGISREKGIVAEWTQNRGKSPGKNVIWFNSELAGRSTPIVMNGMLYVIVRDKPGTPEEGEKVVCADAATGEKKWEYRWNVYLSDVPDTRVGWSSVCGDPDTGDVFALGVCGYFVCLDGKTGKKKWDHSLSEEYGLLSTYGGRTNFPIVHGDLVIISAIIIGWGDMAKPAHRFIAFDKRNGAAVWFEGTRLLPYDTTYSAPSLAVIDGVSQLIFASGDGDIHGFQPQTGKQIWHYRISPKRGVNTAPLVVGSKVYCGHAEENVGDTTMGALFGIDVAGKSGLIEKGKGEMWRHNQWFVGKAAPLYYNGYIYAVENGGSLRIVEAKTGKLVDTLKLGGPGAASPLYADGKIFVVTSNGRWWTFEPQKDGKLKTLYKARLRSTAVHGSPIVSHGRLYIPTTTGMYCVGNKNVKPSADGRPEFPHEKTLKSDPKPALVQVVPCEALMYPGQELTYQVRTYNSRGQLLKVLDNSDVKFTVQGKGQVDDNGRYVAPKDDTANHTAVIISAEVNGVKLPGKARIRVIPKLPWKIDFDNGEIPVTWVGARYRHVPLDYDLFTKLRVEKKNPDAAQLYVYLQSHFTNGLPASPKVPGALVYNNKAPRRNFDGLLKFLDLDTKVKTLDEAKAALDPLLALLEDEKYLKAHTWSESDENGIQLKVEKGTRKLGNGVMMKITTIPKGQRSQGWLGHVDLSNYTIQADVAGAFRKSATALRLPDIGISAQRYALVLKGNQQELEIRTWHPQLRMAKQFPFKWEPFKWYTLKLQASVEGGKAVLRGKCWERGTPEPRDWMITAEDPVPNKIGSPGLFGDAILAESFYDNLQVYPNPKKK